MRKLFALIVALTLSLMVSAGMNISPGTAVHTHADGNTGGASINCAGPCSTKTCVTNFTRVSPHYCRATNSLSSAWADATACTTRVTGASLPATATAVMLHIQWDVVSNNAIGQRINTVDFFNNSACTGSIAARSFVQQREFAAVVAGTVLSNTSDHLIVPLVATDTFATTQLNAGGNGAANISNVFIDGYFD